MKINWSKLFFKNGLLYILNSQDAYAHRRRTGYLILYDRLNTFNTNIAVDEIPRRMPWVSCEYDNNGEAVSDALALPEMSEGDNGTTKIWWDKKVIE